MATLRYLNEFESDQGVNWKVYTDDNITNYVVLDAIQAFEGFTLSYPQQTQTSPRQSYILPSELSLDFQSQISAHDAFQTSLVSANEERFKIKVLKDDVLFWVGFVLTDQVQVEDAAQPHTFNISASDGIGRLKDIDYNNAGTAYSGRATIQEHIFNCLNKIPFSYFHGTGETFIRFIVNWYEDQHTVTSTLDPFLVTDFDHSVFITTDSNGTKKYPSCYDVLKECLQRFGCRMYQSNGYWIVEQINERENANVTVFSYDKDAVHVDTDTYSFDVTVNTSSNSARPRREIGGRSAFYPPLDKVCETYKHDGSDNLTQGVTFAYNSGIVFPPNDEVLIGNIDLSGNNDEVLKITSKINYVSTWLDMLNLKQYRHVFRLKLKVGGQWLKRPIIVIGPGASPYYGSVEWSNEEAYYEITTPTLFQGGTLPGDTQITSFLNIYIETPALIESGEIDFNIFWYQCIEVPDNTIVISDTQPQLPVNLHYLVPETSVNVLQDGTQINMENSRLYCVTNADSDKNTSSISIDSIIGDGPYAVTFNKLKVYDGAAWQVSNDWRVDDTGTAYQIQELTIRQILAGQKLPIKRYEGAIIGDFFAHSRLTWDSEYYLFEGGTFTANTDTWNSKWFNISVDPTGIDTTPSTVESAPIYFPAGPNTGPDNPFTTPGTGGAIAQTGGLTAGPIVEGFLEEIVLSIPTTIPYNQGQILTILNPATGVSDTVTVTAGVPSGSTSIPIEGYITNDYPGGVSIIPDAPQSIEENQLSGEIVTEFFTPGTIDKVGYYLKTNALITETKNLGTLVGPATDIPSGAQNYFYTIPSEMDGAAITKIYTAFYVAGTTGNSTIDTLINAVAINTATIASGSKTADDTLTAPEILSTDDVLTFDATALATTAPKGLNVSLQYTRDAEVYLNKIQYQLNRVELDGLLLWNQFNYLPQIPIGGGSVTFASSDAIECGNDSSLDLTSALTMMCYVKFDDLSLVAGLMGRYASLNGYALVNYGPYIAVVFDSQTACNFTTTGMTNRTWYHVAATYDGTNAYIYLDGVELDTAAYTAPTTAVGDFHIGTTFPAGNFLDGALSQARLWGRALSQIEIQSILYKKYSQLTASEKVGIISDWELYDEADGVFPDSIGVNEGATL